MISVPLLDLGPQNAALHEALHRAFDRVLRSNMFILGKEVEAFESACASFLEVPYAIGVSSGTDALLMALMAEDIGPGDEVLVPDFTFFATAGCVARTGATPVFVDVCPVCFNMDAKDLAAKITPRSRAVIPVHLFGQAAEMDSILSLAQTHGLVVIEDAAQAMGARYRGRTVGSMGDYGAISFFPSKNLGGFGDAGLVTTRDADRAACLRRLRMHGMEPKYFHREIGGNFRIDALQAALLAEKLPHLPDYSHRREENALRYQEMLRSLPGVWMADEACCACRSETSAGAPPDARMILPVSYPHNQSIWNQFTLRVVSPDGSSERRDALRAFLTERKIGCEIYYPVPLHEQKCFAALGVAKEACPVARRLAAEVLSIPIFPDLTQEQQRWVVESLKEWLQSLNA